MILEIDYGNTRLKWRVLDACSLECSSRGAVIGMQELLPALQETGCLALKFCRASSVRSAAENVQLSALIENNYGITIEYAQSLENAAGVSNGYLEACKLGVDRWLSIVAAYSKTQHACVVIDCGTAVTVDYVTVDGRHLGGSIAPGLKLLRAMLKSGTDFSVDVKAAAYDDKILLGDNTQAAVNAGIGAMFRGFISDQLTLAPTLLGPSFSVLCTGGDGALVCDVAGGAVLEADLVFEGLAIICPHLEKE